ncbi:hypothetical protein ACS0TY_032152 [Phlomoides rotata]
MVSTVVVAASSCTGAKVCYSGEGISVPPLFVFIGTSMGIDEGSAGLMKVWRFWSLVIDEGSAG